MDEVKIQYILDENKELAEILKEDAVPVEHPIKYKLINAFEVFVRVKYTENYWISNYGRLVNNLHRKDKTTFYEHKHGKRHYTVYWIEKFIVSFALKKSKNGQKRIDKTKKRSELVLDINLSEEECNLILKNMQENNQKRKYLIERYSCKYDTSTEKLVAKHFLKHRDGIKIWHKDGDENNNWYKNLMYVSSQEYANLKAGKINWQDLEPKQEYVEYKNKASFSAYTAYSLIKKRCINGGNKIDNIPEAYRDVTMCQEWIDNPKAFVKWYLEHYYCIDGEIMAVDKDLFGKEQKIYSPETCCILPQRLNALLANCKKHYYGERTADDLPLGVRYDKEKYYSEIQFMGSGRPIKLSKWDTAEEAFSEYKLMKQADICRVVAEYKDKIPDYIYRELLKIDIQPY